MNYKQYFWAADYLCGCSQTDTCKNNLSKVCSKHRKIRIALYKVKENKIEFSERLVL